MRIIHALLLSLLFFFILIEFAYALPSGFVYLHQVDMGILQDIRYAGLHNFIGRPVKGYEAHECILTKQAAQALSLVQKELQKSSLSLKVYDCYRPTMAVADFIVWSHDSAHQEMKPEFYPRVNKADVFNLGYVAEKSGHSRGSTIDLTIVPYPAPNQASYRRGQHLISCIAPYHQRYQDNSIDMGTGFDCMDALSHGTNRTINKLAYEHRMFLRQLMINNGFEPYAYEWWHFTLKDEPYPTTYFNFKVEKGI